MHHIVRNTREAFKSGKTKSLSFRRSQLSALLKFFIDNYDEMIQVLNTDLHKCKYEAVIMEIVPIVNEVCHHLQCLEEWTSTEIFINRSTSTYTLKQPYGVVLVMGTWSYPLQSLMLPVIAAISAGNCVIMKPSEIAPHVGKFLEQTLPKYIDSDCYKIVRARKSDTNELLKEKFDYIFFSGSVELAKIIREAANKHLTSVWLELGGCKNSVYIDDTVNLKIAIKRLLRGKFTNSGQSRTAPDYILCNSSLQAKIIEITPGILFEFFGDDPQNSPDLSRIGNEIHFNRVVKLLQSGTIALGGHIDYGELYISPTILISVNLNDPIMQEEIFGPILPIVTINGLDEAITFINNCYKPLVLYVFSSNEKDINKIIDETSSNRICVNDTIHGDSVSGKDLFNIFTRKINVLYNGYNPITLSCKYSRFSGRQIKSLQLFHCRLNILFISIDIIIAFILGLFAVYLIKLYL